MNTNKHTKYTLAGLGLSVGLAVAAAGYGINRRYLGGSGR